jgi:hypothetical protein
MHGLKLQQWSESAAMHGLKLQQWSESAAMRGLKLLKQYFTHNLKSAP